MTGPFYDNPGQYDELLGHQSDDITFYKNQALQIQAQDVLDLGCGTGRVALEIAKCGLQVVGIDTSSSMLQKAKEKAKDTNSSIHFELQDMKNVRLSKKFEFIYSSQGSLQHLLKTTDLVDTLSSVKAHLKSGGLFSFDIVNPEIKLLAQESRQKFLVRKYTNAKTNSQVQVYQQAYYEAANQLCYLKWSLESEGKLLDQQEFCLRMYFPQEIDFILRSQGFEIVQKYGSAAKAEFGPQSRHQFIVCAAE